MCRWKKTYRQQEERDKDTVSYLWTLLTSQAAHRAPCSHPTLDATYNRKGREPFPFPHNRLLRSFSFPWPVSALFYLSYTPQAWPPEGRQWALLAQIPSWFRPMEKVSGEFEAEQRSGYLPSSSLLCGSRWAVALRKATASSWKLLPHPWPQIQLYSWCFHKHSVLV